VEEQVEVLCLDLLLEEEEVELEVIVLLVLDQLVCKVLL
jgi:hypothetical protein